MTKALFLDRDGTINIDYGYVWKIEDFKFVDGIFDLCKKALKKGYMIIVITNQSGIAKGYFTESDLKKVNTYMIAEFSKENIKITDVFYCPDLSGARRKPECGMFLEAKKKYNIDMAASVSVGDKERDIMAAIKAGCGKNFLLNNNFEEIMEAL